MMLRTASCALAVIGVLAFPWPLTLVFAGVAALFVPPLALLVGVLVDVLYFVPGAYPVPLGTLLGLTGFLIALMVQGFMKTRIMGA